MGYTTNKPRRGKQAALAGTPVEQFDKWRQQFNPLRGLTIARAVSMLDSAQRGDYSDLQWAYRFIERRDEDLIALIERRVNALVQLDWSVKLVDERTAKRRGIRVDSALAEAQAAELVAAYNRIGNLYQAVEHLEMAAFREFSVCQLQSGDVAAEPGEATHIECLNHWNIIRDGMQGGWYWNASAMQTTALNLGETNRIDERYCLVRQWPRPLDEIGLLKFIRSSLSRKNWDAFIEIYGIPGWIVIMPPNIPSGKESEYMASAQAIAEGRPGALPNGSDAKCADQPRGVNPFRDAMQFLTEKLVLAGTGGLLTMLSQAGSGTLAGSAHMEAFDIVARGEARKISELFQAQFDARLLASRFPGKPVLAYFELAANEEQDVGEILDHAVKISQAGGQPDWNEISEKTGYTITAKPAVQNPIVPGLMGQVIPNRNRVPSTLNGLSKALAGDLAPVRKRIETVLALPDDQIPMAAEKLRAELPTLLKEIGSSPEAAAVMASELQAALDRGIQARKESNQ